MRSSTSSLDQAVLWVAGLVQQYHDNLSTKNEPLPLFCGLGLRRPYTPGQILGGPQSGIWKNPLPGCFSQGAP